MRKLKVYNQRNFIRTMVIFTILIAVIIAIPVSGLVNHIVIATTNHIVTKESYDAKVKEYENMMTTLKTKIDAEKNQVNQTLEQKESEIDKLQKEINALNSKIVEIKKDKEDIQKKYSYVFRDKKHMPGATISYEDLKQLDTLCKKNNVNPHMIVSVWKVESSWNTHSANKTSSARGYGQFLSGTARSIWVKLYKNKKYDHSMATIPKVGVQLSAEYWRYLLVTQRGNVRNCFKLYRGEGGSILKNYMADVNSYMKKNTGYTINDSTYH